jgi:TonB family protein
VLGVDGKVRDIEVVKSAGLDLDEKAVEAVGTCRFKPGI